MEPNNIREPHYSFEEFKLIYESAEKVTDRRLGRNTQNYSISVGVVLAIAVIANWSVTNLQYRYAGFTLLAAISIMAAIYTRLWLRQILDFKALNTAKFKILNEMAPLLKFESKGPEAPCTSYEPFRREWEIVQTLNALQSSHGKKFVALRSTNEELFVPNALFVVFTLVFATSIIAIGSHLSEFVAAWQALLFGP